MKIRWKEVIKAREKVLFHVEIFIIIRNTFATFCYLLIINIRHAGKLKIIILQCSHC